MNELVISYGNDRFLKIRNDLNLVKYIEIIPFWTYFY